MRTPKQSSAAGSMRPIAIASFALLVIGTGTVLAFLNRSWHANETHFEGPQYAGLHAHATAKPAPYSLATLRQAAALLNPELMDHAPPTDPTKFANTTNPCWFDKTNTLQCLPKLLLLGGFHSGAKTITHSLKQHPNVITTRSTENQFWAEDGKTMSDYLSGWREGTDKLMTQPDKNIFVDMSQSTFEFYWAAGTKPHLAYIKAVRTLWEECNKAHGGKPEYDTCMEQAMKSARETDAKVATDGGIDYLLDAHVPLLMHAVYGDRVPRLIVLARDPVERLHSAFYGYPQYTGKYGATPEGFLAFVEEQLKAFETCAADHGPLRCALYFETLGMGEEKVFYHCDQVLRGLYSVWLEVWLRFFPKKSLLVIPSEELFEHPTAVIQKVIAHAGLPSVTKAQIQGWFKDLTIPRHVRDKRMLPHARDRLQAFYAPYNKRLAKLTRNAAFLEWNHIQLNKLQGKDTSDNTDGNDTTISGSVK